MDSKISEKQQLKWFDRLHADASKKYFIFSIQGVSLGMLYFTDIDISSCSWGCYLGEERVWPGSGLILSLAALLYAFEMIKIDTLKAEVLEFNQGPQRMHNLLGYHYDGKVDNVVKRNNKEFGLLKYFIGEKVGSNLKMRF